MRALPVAAALLLVSACAYSPRVVTDFDPSANFAGYRTYSWAPVDVPRGMNPLMFRRVQASIDRSLQARGYTQADPGDFAIAFTIGEQDRTEINSYGGYWGPGWGWGCCGRFGWGGWGWGGGPWGWGGWGYPYPDIDTYQVTDRSIVIDIYDQPTKRPVWHGVITNTGYPDQVDYSKLDANVDAVLARFPPQAVPGAPAPSVTGVSH
jgi:hypothetical protein